MNHDPDRICVGCFADLSLKALVKANLEPGAGTCAHCGRDRVRAASAHVLGDLLHDFAWGFFEPVEESWERSSPLFDHFVDFGVFSDAVSEAGGAERLLEEILTSGRRPDDEYLDLERWRRRESPRYQGGARWYLNELRRLVEEYGHALDHVIDTRSTFVHGAASRERLLDDLDHLEALVPAGTRLFRARVGGAVEGGRGPFGRVAAPYTGKEIAAPPPHLSRSDRVAVAGQRLLFLADCRETAIAEVRPAIGDVVSSAAFVTQEDLRVVDLTSRPPPSGTVRECIDQLRRRTLADEIGREFSLPVGSDGTRHYLLTQYVARCAERRRYDGIKYPSSQSDSGFNLVLFDPERAGEPDEPALTRVLGVEYSMGEHDFWTDKRPARRAFEPPRRREPMVRRGVP